MTDKKVFMRFMELMGMGLDSSQIDSSTKEEAFIYSDDGMKPPDNFQKFGYENFNSGAVFNEKEEMILGFMDSHVAFSSDFKELIQNFINKNKGK